MAKFSYDDDEPALEKARLSAQPQATPTFAQLQQQGMPRPPAIGWPAHGAFAGAYAARNAASQPRQGGVMQALQNARRPQPQAGPPAQAPTAPAAPGYVPTNELNQGNLEGYLYDMLSDPTNTPTYKNIMRRVGADIDVDASRRGVFHSTIPVGAYSEAGAQLAGGLQQQAFGNLRGYNQDYEQLLLALLGMS
ncbi:MAG: hypothetical protein L0Z53_06755 [Acidobacteriales bacterium]|nr:hypothetical protein [Terriglobales bacterium]